MGLPAGSEYNALLGLPTSVPATATTVTMPGGTPSAGTTPVSGYTGPSLSQIMAMPDRNAGQAAMNAYLSYYQAHPDQDPGFTNISPFHGDPYSDESGANAVLAARNAYLSSHPAGTPTPAAPTPAPAQTPGTPTTTGAATPGASPNNALSGFNTFYNSPTYQVPLAAGLKGVNTKYAAAGALESGAAMKAINDYAAGNASQALSTYMDDLARQEALGASSASALAGVGQNMVSQVSANNNNAAGAAGNAQLVAGQGAANTWNAFGSGVGQIAGSVAGAMGSSYSPNNAAAPVANYHSPYWGT